MKRKDKRPAKLIEKTRSFNDTVAENFDLHVNQSIPHYSELQNYLVQLSEWFLKDNETVYDLGCSTGETIKKLLELDISTRTKIIGIDKSKKMLDLAREKIKKVKNNNVKVTFEVADVSSGFELEDCNLVLSTLLFPFLNFDNKKLLLKKIYQSLQEGGALIAVEKVRSRNSTFEDLLNQLYYDFKLSKNLSEKEIILKAKSLRSSMSLYTEEDLFKTIEDSGFKEHEIFFKCFNFVGYIALK